MHVRKKCLGSLASIRRASPLLQANMRKLLYTSLILPYMDYCSVVWNSWSRTLHNIERVQNYAMRLILNKPPLTRSEPLRHFLHWFTLKERRDKSTLIQVHRCISGVAPAYLSSKFQTNSNLQNFQGQEVDMEESFISNSPSLITIEILLNFKKHYTFQLFTDRHTNNTEYQRL